jgi:hypothetical protein
MASIKDCKGEWFQIWTEDKECIVETMWRNLEADITAGYDPLGNIVRKQLDAINDYREEMDNRILSFYKMTDEEVDRWCFYDLKRRGAIA